MNYNVKPCHSGLDLRLKELETERAVQVSWQGEEGSLLSCVWPAGGALDVCTSAELCRRTDILKNLSLLFSAAEVLILHDFLQDTQALQNAP